MSDNEIYKVPIPESTVENLINPAAESTGNALETIVESIFHFSLDGLRRYNIVKDKDLNDFYNKVNGKTAKIPIENRDDSKMGLALKSIEDSRYQLNEDIMREMFANILSSTLDNRKNDRVSPVFSHILSNITKKEAEFLSKLNQNGRALPLVSIEQYDDFGRSITPIKNIVLFDDNHDLTCQKTLDMLSLFELIKIDPNTNLGSSKYKDMYARFEASQFYSDIKGSLPQEISGFTFVDTSIIEGRVTVSDLGIDFIDIVL